MSIFLEVSLGEALDKLSILEIKYEKITDERNKHVKIEYDYLKNELSEYLKKYDYFYKILKKINLEIWELQDNLRLNNLEKENFYITCDEILNLNDSRYLVKKKLNELCLSKLKEQKGYNLRNLNIILNVELEQINYFNGFIRYYSFYYDNIYIYSNEEIYNTLKNDLSDDVFIIVKNIIDIEIDEKHDTIKIDNFNVEKKIAHTYFANKKKLESNNNNMYAKQINKLYDDLNLDIKICCDYKNISKS